MGIEKKEKSDLFRNITWLFGAKSGKSILVSIELVILARFLGVEKFGLFSLVIAYVNIVNKLFDFRVWEACIRYVGEYFHRDQKEEAVSMIKFSYLVDVISGLVAFFICIAAAGLANEIFIKSDIGTELIYIYSAFLLVSTANTTSEALYRVFDRFKTITVVNTVEAFFRLLAVVVVIFFGGGIKEVLFAYIGAAFFSFLLRQIVVQGILRENGLDNWLFSKLKPVYPRMKEICWFLLNTSLNATLKMAGEGNLGVLFLGHFSGAYAAGLYRVARSVIKLMAKIVDPVYEAIYPKLVGLSTQNMFAKSADIIKYALTSLLKFVFPVAAVLLVFAEILINLVFGNDYVEAANTMRVLTLATLFSGATFWVTPSLLALGRPGFRTTLNLFKTVLYVSFLLLLVPRYSYLGAAFAYLLAEIINFTFSIYLKGMLQKKI